MRNNNHNVVLEGIPVARKARPAKMDPGGQDSWELELELRPTGALAATGVRAC